jgi:hypothetical protein
VLSIGSSPKADIRLPHGSVAPLHCRLSAKTSEGRSDISIQPLKAASIKVNDIEQPAKTPLSDKDLIGIGDFILLFSNPEAQKSVVVHFLDGRTMRGTPVTWDIATPSFELLRTDSEEMEETADEITVVNFVDLKAVFFVQDASGAGSGVPKEKIKTDELLEVTFFDGEKVEGHPLTDYSDVARRFYLVPSEMPNIVSILVERQNIKESVTRKSPAGAEAKAGGRLRRRGGTASAE